jgi:hypothetical protein
MCPVATYLPQRGAAADRLCSTVTRDVPCGYALYGGDELLLTDCTRQLLRYVPCGYVHIAAMSCRILTVLGGH